MVFTQTTMLFIQKTLAKCEVCTGFYGAALSSPDGLVLALHGQISGDEAAACASSLFVDSATSLSYINESQPTAMLIWTESKIFSLHRLKDGSIFLLVASRIASDDVIRKFAEKTADALNNAMGFLV